MSNVFNCVASKRNPTKLVLVEISKFESLLPVASNSYKFSQPAKSSDVILVLETFRFVKALISVTTKSDNCLQVLRSNSFICVPLKSIFSMLLSEQSKYINSGLLLKSNTVKPVLKQPKYCSFSFLLTSKEVTEVPPTRKPLNSGKNEIPVTSLISFLSVNEISFTF